MWVLMLCWVYFCICVVKGVLCRLVLGGSVVMLLVVSLVSRLVVFIIMFFIILCMLGCILVMNMCSRKKVVRLVMMKKLKNRCRLIFILLFLFE